MMSLVSPPAALTWHWAKTHFRAMNTDVYAWLYSSLENSTAILADVEALFNSIEHRLSRFQPNSELTTLNQATSPHQASTTLFTAIEVALWAADLTSGLFDPTILPELQQAGYGSSFETVAATGAACQLPQQPLRGRYRQLQLYPARRIIDKPAEIKLDLGGIGKGWTVDQGANRLAGLGTPFLLNAGGDLYAYGAPPGSEGWLVEVPHPTQDNHTLALLRVANRAIATSSLARRRWQRGGRILHHLIDPRTSQPADTDLLSVTVIADLTVLAEVLAKTALILGSEAGLAYLERQPNVAALLVTQTGAVLQTSSMEPYQQ